MVHIKDVRVLYYADETFSTEHIVKSVGEKVFKHYCLTLWCLNI